MFRVIIAGGRKFNNYSLLKEKCDNILSNVNDRIAIVCGCADGADLLGGKYAKEKDYIIHYYPANWRLYGKSAGMIRNKSVDQSKKDTKYSEFEIEFNALVRKHFPHWEAKEIF